LKENVAVGRLIPAGSGSPHLKNILVSDPELASNEEKTPAEKKSEKEVV
jgi:hypothetical protein